MVGYTYSPAISATVYVNHQEPSGWWEPLTNSGSTITVYIQQHYFSNLNNAEVRSGYDVAVVQRNTPLSNVVSSDVAALARSVYQKPLGLYVYGHGIYAPTVYGDRGGPTIVYDDEQLRLGKFSNLTWYTSWGNAWYRSVMTDYELSDPHFCRGDSDGRSILYGRQGSSNGVFVAVATKVVTPERGGNAELGRWLRSECEHCVSPNPKLSAIASRERSSAKRRKPRPPADVNTLPT